MHVSCERAQNTRRIHSQDAQTHTHTHTQIHQKRCMYTHTHTHTHTHTYTYTTSLMSRDMCPRSSACIIHGHILHACTYALSQPKTTDMNTDVHNNKNKNKHVCTSSQTLTHKHTYYSRARVNTHSNTHGCTHTCAAEQEAPMAALYINVLGVQPLSRATSSNFKASLRPCNKLHKQSAMQQVAQTVRNAAVCSVFPLKASPKQCIKRGIVLCVVIPEAIQACTCVAMREQ
jgi:hypothetical protein